MRARARAAGSNKRMQHFVLLMDHRGRERERVRERLTEGEPGENNKWLLLLSLTFGKGSGCGSKHVYKHMCVCECVRNALISIDVARFKRIFDVRFVFVVVLSTPK